MDSGLRIAKGLIINPLFLWYSIKEVIRCRFTTVKFYSDKRMDGKTVLITGGSSGLGKATAFDLSSRGARVILACLYMDEAKEAQDQIIKATGNENVIIKFLDVSSMEDVRRFATEFLENEPRLDVLINNAGIGVGQGFTKEGLLKVMATNYFGAFLLTHLLLDLLVKSAPSRILNISSCLHKMAVWRDLRYMSFDTRLSAYPFSKLYLLTFTIRLAEKLEGTGVTVNAVHPGGVRTRIFSGLSPLENCIAKPAQMAFRGPREGAITHIYLSISDDVSSVTGKYFMDCEVADISKLAKDSNFRENVWKKTEHKIKMRPEEKLEHILRKHSQFVPSTVIEYTKM